MLIAAALLVLLFILYAYAFYRDAYASPRKGQNDVYRFPRGSQFQPWHSRMRALIGALENAPSEELSLRSRDGLMLRARFYPGREDMPVALCMHGYRSVAQRDFCGAAALLRELGCGIVLPDERAHGKSEGSAITFGIRERTDVLDWALLIRERFGADTPILLMGLSMGAATVLMASDLPLPENVRLIIADCPYADPLEIITLSAVRRGYPKKLSEMMARISAGLFGHFPLLEASPLKSVPHTRVPIILVHGEEDHFVPCSMSVRIRDACPSMTELHLFPGAGHGLSFFMDTDRYTRILADAVARCREEGHDDLDT